MTKKLKVPICGRCGGYIQEGEERLHYANINVSIHKECWVNIIKNSEVVAEEEIRKQLEEWKELSNVLISVGVTDFDSIKKVRNFILDKLAKSK